jgi:hypothetical protein
VVVETYPNWVISPGWKLFTGGISEFEGFTVKSNERVHERVEVKLPANAKAVMVSGEVTNAWVGGLA